MIVSGKLGLKAKQRLKPNAVPTIFPRPGVKKATKKFFLLMRKEKDPG